MKQESRTFLHTLEGGAKFFRRMFEAGVSLGALMRIVNHKEILERVAVYINAGCPEIVYQNGIATADLREQLELADFFQKQPGLWVDSELKRYIDFNQQLLEQTEALEYTDLEKESDYAQLFGVPGTPEHEETLRTAVTMKQIRQKIVAQWGGTPGDLLTNGQENLFAVFDRDYELCIVRVYWVHGHNGWRVSCSQDDWKITWPNARVFRGSVKPQ